MSNYDDEKVDNHNSTPATTDLENTNTRYKNSIYETDPNVDMLDQNDTLPADAPLDAGVFDDAFTNYDMDDATLPADNNVDVLETGMDSVDGDNLHDEQDKLGDVVMGEPQLGDESMVVEEIEELDEDLDDDEFDEDEDLDDDEIDIEE